MKNKECPHYGRVAASLVFGIVLLGVLPFFLAGCAEESAPEYDTLFSPVYREFSRHTLTAGKTAAIRDFDKRGSWNKKTLRGSLQLRGIMTSYKGGLDPRVTMQLVDHFVKKHTNQYHVEGDIPKSVTTSQNHVYTCWMYNYQKRHGEIHIWLFPEADLDRMNFAVFIREEEL